MKKDKKVKRRMRIYLLVIVGLLSFFVYKMSYYWPKILANYEEKAMLDNEYQKLLKEEKDLATDIIKLKDPEYIARYAREKYMYSKDGEVIIKIVE